jgi:hypothetical protein
MLGVRAGRKELVGGGRVLGKVALAASGSPVLRCLMIDLADDAGRTFGTASELS